MANRPSRSVRADLYTRITADIIAAIEAGAGEWQMPWHHDGGSIARPRNIASDKAYRGINVLALWVAAHRARYTSGIWGTCLKLFYRLGLDSCLEVDAKSVLLGSQVEGLGGMAYAAAIDARHGAWSAQLPKDTAGLWDVLCGFDGNSRQALFAHCVGLTINATCQPYDRRPKAIAHADRLAERPDRVSWAGSRERPAARSVPLTRGSHRDDDLRRRGKGCRGSGALLRFVEAGRRIAAQLEHRRIFIGLRTACSGAGYPGSLRHRLMGHNHSRAH